MFLLAVSLDSGVTVYCGKIFFTIIAVMPAFAFLFCFCSSFWYQRHDQETVRKSSKNSFAASGGVFLYSFAATAGVFLYSFAVTGGVFLYSFAGSSGNAVTLLILKVIIAVLKKYCFHCICDRSY